MPRKYEKVQKMLPEVQLHSSNIATRAEAKRLIDDYIYFYNNQRIQKNKTDTAGIAVSVC